MMVEGAITKMDLELVRNEKGVFTENERGQAEEFVFHGSKLEGVAHIIKKNKEIVEKKRLVQVKS